MTTRRRSPALLRRLEIGEGIEVDELDASTIRRAAGLRVQAADVVESTSTSSLALASTGSNRIP